MIKRKICHSRENGNPFAISFKISSVWMPAFAGMTNYEQLLDGGGNNLNFDFKS
jgi:hypothetical protein